MMLCLKEICMTSSTHCNDALGGLYVYQKPVRLDVKFAMIGPIANKCMIFKQRDVFLLKKFLKNIIKLLNI